MAELEELEQEALDEELVKVGPTIDTLPSVPNQPISEPAEGDCYYYFFLLLLLFNFFMTQSHRVRCCFYCYRSGLAVLLHNQQKKCKRKNVHIISTAL